MIKIDKSIYICVTMIIIFKVVSFLIYKANNINEKPENTKWKFSFYDIMYYISIAVPIIEFMKNAYFFRMSNIIIGTFMIIVGIIIMIAAELGLDSYKSLKYEKSMKIYYYIRFPFTLSDFLFLGGISISLQSIFGGILVLSFLIIEFIKIKSLDKYYQENLIGYKEYSSKTKLIIPFLL